MKDKSKTSSPKWNILSDILSGTIMAATSIPQLIAYAETAGYAGYRGLATAGPPLLVWGCITGNPYLTGGVSAVTALMAKTDLRQSNSKDELEYVYLMGAYTLCVSAASLILALVGFGRIAKLVPKAVQQGFKWGCYVGVLVSAFPNGFYAQGKSDLEYLLLSLESSFGMFSMSQLLRDWKGSFPSITNVAGFFYTLLNPSTWSTEPTVLFLSSCLFLLYGKNYIPKFLPPGTEVLIVTGISLWYSSHYGYDASIVGQIPPADPEAGITLGGLRIPIELLDVSKIMKAPLLECFGGSIVQLAISSLLFAGIGFLSILSICSVFESEDGIAWSSERELMAQAGSCAMAGLMGSAPVSGALSRSLVQRMTGATSQLTCIVTALCWIYLQPYMSIMSPTPKAALAAIIVCSVIRGVLFPKDLLAAQGLDAVVCWGTGIATAITSPTQGFAFGLLLFGSMYPFRGSTTKEKAA